MRYPRDSSPPVWSSPGRDLQTERFNITLSNGDRLMSDSVPDTERVVSQLTITDVTEDEGEYTCSVEGQSDTFSVSLGKSGNTGQGSNDDTLHTCTHTHNNFCPPTTVW